MIVAQAIQDRRFQMRTHCIEVGHKQFAETGDAYHLKQISLGKDHNGLMFIERYRGFKSALSDPLPRWQVMRGSGICVVETVTVNKRKEIKGLIKPLFIDVPEKINKNGFYGLWVGHPNNLMAECKLVLLGEDDIPKDICGASTMRRIPCNLPTDHEGRHV